MDIEEAKKLAKLSRLEFTENEFESFLKEFDKTLEKVNIIQKVDTSNIQLQEKAVSMESLRPDIVQQNFTQSDVIANAPQSEGGAFVVPITVEEGEQ